MIFRLVRHGSLSLAFALVACSDGSPGEPAPEVMPDGVYELQVEGPDWRQVMDIPGWAAGDNLIQLRKDGSRFLVVSDSRGNLAAGQEAIAVEHRTHWALLIPAAERPGWYNAKVSASWCRDASVTARDRKWSLLCSLSAAP